MRDAHDFLGVSHEFTAQSAIGYSEFSGSVDNHLTLMPIGVGRTGKRVQLATLHVKSIDTGRNTTKHGMTHRHSIDPRPCPLDIYNANSSRRIDSFARSEEHTSEL